MLFGVGHWEFADQPDQPPTLWVKTNRIYLAMTKRTNLEKYLKTKRQFWGLCFCPFSFFVGLPVFLHPRLPGLFPTARLVAATLKGLDLP